MGAVGIAERLAKVRVERLWGLKVIGEQIWAIRKQEKAYTEVTESAEFAEKANPRPRHTLRARGTRYPHSTTGVEMQFAGAASTVKAAPRRRTPRRRESVPLRNSGGV